jgi:hypothetical protein
MVTAGHWSDMDDAVVAAVLALAPLLQRCLDEPDVAVPGERASGERERASTLTTELSSRAQRSTRRLTS